MEKCKSKSSPRMEIQRYCQGKFPSMVVSKGMSFLRNMWCCATGVKLGTCLARITLWLHPPLNILVCLLLSKVVLLRRIKILYNLILLQRITLAVSCPKNILLRRRILTLSPNSRQKTPPSEGLSDSDLHSESDSESYSDSDSQNESGSESMVSWEESPALPSEDTSPVSQKDQATPKAASSWESDSNTPVKDNQISKDTAKIKKQKTNTATKKRLRTLWNFSLPPIYRRWYYTDVFAIASSKANITIMYSTKITRECLIIAADLIDRRSNTNYLSKLNSYTENFSLQRSI